MQLDRFLKPRAAGKARQLESEVNGEDRLRIGEVVIIFVGSGARAAKLVEVLDARTSRAVEALHLRIRRLNHIILVRRMRTAAVTKTEMAGWQPERIPCEDITGPGAGQPRHDDGINARPLI